MWLATFSMRLGRSSHCRYARTGKCITRLFEAISDMDQRVRQYLHVAINEKCDFGSWPNLMDVLVQSVGFVRDTNAPDPYRRPIAEKSPDFHNMAPDTVGDQRVTVYDDVNDGFDTGNRSCCRGNGQEQCCLGLAR